MTRITKNISKHELKCKCNNCDVYIHHKERIVHIVQSVCDQFAKLNNVDKIVLKIPSAARCYVYNRSVGSNDSSQHPRTRAMDIQLFLPNGTQIPPELIYEFVNNMYPESLGIGSYKTFTHIDTRPYRARWLA